MTTETSVELEAEERDEFLGDGGVGVISFSTGGEEPPHSIPVSYGYDAVETTFYFRLAVGPDSQKGDVGDRSVTFVVHAGKDYYGELLPQLEAIDDVSAEIPTEGLRIGEKLAWYGDRLDV